jgi:hypothetical protein
MVSEGAKRAKEWRKNNPDKIKAYRERTKDRRDAYYEKNKADIKIKRDIYYAENREEIAKKKRAKNPGNTIMKLNKANGLFMINGEIYLENKLF